MRIITFDIETANTTINDFNSLEISVVGIHDSETNEYTCFEVEEFPTLWKILEGSDMLVGYNSDHFDIPILNKYYPGNLTDLKSLDILKEIYGSLGRRVRLDSVAEGTLGTNKSGSGADAPRWWREGLKEKVKEYCKKDVEITKRVFDYALLNQKLKFKELGKVKEVNLDTSKWLEKDDSALTHTLGL